MSAAGPGPRTGHALAIQRDKGEIGIGALALLLGVNRDKARGTLAALVKAGLARPVRVGRYAPVRR